MNKLRRKNMLLTAGTAIFLSIALSGCIVPQRAERRQHKKKQHPRRHISMAMNNVLEAWQHADKLWNQWGQ